MDAPPRCPIQPLHLTVLVENTCPGGGLVAEHGLAMLLETERGTVLFDTGATPAVLAANAQLPAEQRFATFGGEAVDATSVLVRFTWAADVTLDGQVGDADATVIGANYDGGATTGRYWWEGDLTGDGRISDPDVTILGALYPRSWAGIEEVDPDPRSTAVVSITIAFSLPVYNFDLGDLVLTRGGEAVSLSSATLTNNSGGNMNFTLSGLSGLTGTAGTYVLTLSGSGITGFVGADVSETWVKV